MEKNCCVQSNSHYILMFKLISIVKAVDAVTRKPSEYEIFTFFSIYDQWLYHFVSDNRLCERCEAFAHETHFAGNELRTNFSDLQIIDENLIYANVHPNCRCYLIREVNINDPRMTGEERVKKYGT